MEINYKEGMFLGKEELDRQAVLGNMLSDSLKRLLGNTSSLTDKRGLLNCYKLGVSIAEGSNKTIYLGVNAGITVSNELGRVIVGWDKNGSLIGLPLVGAGWTHLYKEAVGSFAVLEDGTYRVVLASAITHYENSLISISSSGVGTLTANTSVINLFRTATNGRQTKIQTENGTILTVQSVDKVNGTIQFAGTSFVSETNVRFMFVQTLSPFVNDAPEPLYNYPSCVLTLEPKEGSLPPTTGLRFVVAEIEVSAGEVIDSYLYDGNPSGYTWLDTVAANQIVTPLLANSAVTTVKISSSAITTPKIASSAVTPLKLSFGFAAHDLRPSGPGPGPDANAYPGHSYWTSEDLLSGKVKLQDLSDEAFECFLGLPITICCSVIEQKAQGQTGWPGLTIVTPAEYSFLAHGDSAPAWNQEGEIIYTMTFLGYTVLGSDRKWHWAMNILYNGIS